MRVVVPAVAGMLAPEVVPAILRDAWAVEVWPIHRADEYGYSRLLRSLWRRGETFVLVEQDIEVPPGALTEFDECPELWCAHSYPVGDGGIAETRGGAWGLGLVRFRGELMRAIPGLLDDAQAGGVRLAWRRLDSAVSLMLRAHGVNVHRHYPDAIHHHDYSVTP